jgi:hypothetical protein
MKSDLDLAIEAIGVTVLALWPVWLALALGGLAWLSRG